VALAVLIAASCSLASSLLRGSPVGPLLSLLARLAQAYAFLLGLGTTALELDLQGAALELDLSPLAAALLVSAALLALADALGSLPDQL